MLDKVKDMSFLPFKTDGFDYMEQRVYDFVKHCNETAYAGFLDTIDSNLNTANEMGKKDDFVFMKGSDDFGLTGEFVSFDPHLDRIMAHRLQRLIDTGVYFIWEKWIAIRHRTVKKSALDSSQKPIKMDSDMVSLLSTVLILYVKAGLFWCCEIHFTLFTLFWKFKCFRHFVHFK